MTRILLSTSAKKCKGVWTDSNEIDKIAEYIKLDPRVIEICQSLTGNKALEELRQIEAVVYQLLMALG